MFKKTVLIVAFLLCSANVWAVTRDVSATRHNFSSTQDGANWFPPGNNYMATNEDEVCIFCHTPHGGALNTPLWNRNVPVATGFTHYTSSTLSSYMQTLASNRVVSDESMLCMSCHDGQYAMNAITNYSNNTVGGVPDNGLNKIQSMFGNPGALIGDTRDPLGGFSTPGYINNLSDDHPISFSYYSATLVEAALHKADGGANDPRLKGIRFFGAGAVAGGQRVECSSCHDPHINYEAGNGGDANYTPFLVMSNTGSALCLACHIK